MSKSRFEQRIDQICIGMSEVIHRPMIHHVLMGLLTDLRREIASDGPTCRPPGALEAFDKACDALEIPFLEP